MPEWFHRPLQKIGIIIAGRIAVLKTKSFLSFKEQRVYEIFNSIAPRYDVTNLIMSLGIHHYWRKKLIQSLSLSKGCTILDLCCGTGAVAQDLARLIGTGGQVVGVDFSEAMLSIAKDRESRCPTQNPIRWIRANALDLPFPDGSFDCITIAYGLRNLTDIPRALAEMGRVLKPDGQIAILEMAVPEHPVIKRLHRLYLNGWVPILGNLSSHNRKAYQYLYESIRSFPHPDRICRLLEDTGFIHIRCLRLTWGIVALYTGRKRPE